MTDADDADNFALLANTSAQIECQLQSQDQAGGIGINVNAIKTEFMCFKQEGTIFNLSGSPLKLVDQFTYLSSNISSTKSDVNIYLAKA